MTVHDCPAYTTVLYPERVLKLQYTLKETDVFWKCYTEINRILFHSLSFTWQLVLNALTTGQHFSLQFLQLPISNRTSKSTKQRGQEIHRAAITNDRFPGNGLDTCFVPPGCQWMLGLLPYSLPYSQFNSSTRSLKGTHKRMPLSYCLDLRGYFVELCSSFLNLTRFCQLMTMNHHQTKNQSCGKHYSTVFPHLFSTFIQITVDSFSKFNEGFALSPPAALSIVLILFTECSYSGNLIVPKNQHFTKEPY